MKYTLQEAQKKHTFYIFIPDNAYHLKSGYYTINQIVSLLRKFSYDEDAVHFIADMMEE